MKRIVCIAVILSISIASPAFALYSISDFGQWPRSWPKELEPLRKQSRTFVGPILPHEHYAIPFTERTEFEAAWPALLQVRSQGAPVFLVRESNFFLKDAKAGVVIHAAPRWPQGKPARPEEPIESSNVRERWMYTTCIEVVVDGEIVDLNRLPLSNAPIIDERFGTDPPIGRNPE